MTSVPLGLVEANHRPRGRVVVGLLVAALVLASAGLTLVRLPDEELRLSANVQAAISIADVVDIRPSVAAPPPPPPREGPIDVPSDPYAKEPVVRLGRIEIPSLGVDQVLMHGVTLNNIDHGPSHWPGSALPGAAGNTVIAGHRVTHSKPFRNIDRLVPGDQVFVTAQGVRATYSVRDTIIVYPTQMEIVNPTPNGILTLFACHPPRSARQRIVVRAELVGSAAA